MTAWINLLASIQFNVNQTPSYIPVPLNIKHNSFYDKVLSTQDISVPNEIEGLLKPRT
jgi:hypothetical protein